MEGLANLGRPATVFFPVELIEQGLSLLLSGLNNTLAVQSNPDWVWPLWLERQQDPETAAFIPTGVNLMTANLSMRNWTSLGLADSRKEIMVDPAGMLTLWPFGWSLFPYLRMEDRHFLPPRLGGRIGQQLEGGVYPRVITQYHVSDHLSWTSKIMALEADGEELIEFSHHLVNHAQTPVSITLGIAIRPYNSLTIGHINRIKFKNRLWRVNRKPGLLLMEEPHEVRVSDRHRGDPLFTDAPNTRQIQGVSKSGILSGVAEYRFHLEPGERKSVHSFGILGKTSNRPNLKFHNLDRDVVSEALGRTRSQWAERNKQGMTLSLPDKRLETAFHAVKNHLHVFDDQDHFTPGTFFYHSHWIRDSAFIAAAFENLSMGSRVAAKMKGYLATQTRDGFFRSQNGEWDSAGQAMVTLVNHVRRNHDTRLLEQMKPALLKGVRWIEHMRGQSLNAKTPHMGLLPAGISAEHFGPNDHYFWDNFWCLAGIRDTVWALDKLGAQSEKARIPDIHDAYEHDLRAAMDAAMTRSGNMRLPTSPYRNMDSAGIGNLVAITPLDLFPSDCAWAKPTVDFLLQHNLHKGLFFQKIIHTGLNAYLSAQLAKTLIALDDSRFETILTALLDFAGPTFTWPEAINPATRGGCMGDGDHGWAAAEFVGLVRDMLVREQGDALMLGAGIPRHWFKPNMRVEVNRASTRHGLISYILTAETKALTIRWRLKRNPLQEERPMYLLLPQSLPMGGELVSPHGVERSRVLLKEQRGSLFIPIFPLEQPLEPMRDVQGIKELQS